MSAIFRRSKLAAHKAEASAPYINIYNLASEAYRFDILVPALLVTLVM